jgi:hypothetical protein
MTISTALLTLALAADAFSPQVQAMRERPRFHGELSLAGGFGVAPPAFGAGPGVYVEAGIVMEDAHTVSLRGSLVTLVSIGVLQAGAMFSEFIGDHFTFGGGIAWTFMSGIVLDLPTAASIHVPIRIQWLANERAAHEEARRGFTIGLEFAPGLAYALSNGFSIAPAPVTERMAPTTPAVSVSALLTIGYAAW